jgi:hypothetical protein
LEQQRDAGGRARCICMGASKGGVGEVSSRAMRIAGDERPTDEGPLGERRFRCPPPERAKERTVVLQNRPPPRATPLCVGREEGGEMARGGRCHPVAADGSPLAVCRRHRATHVHRVQESPVVARVCAAGLVEGGEVKAHALCKQEILIARTYVSARAQAPCH